MVILRLDEDWLPFHSQAHQPCASGVWVVHAGDNDSSHPSTNWGQLAAFLLKRRGVSVP